MENLKEDRILKFRPNKLEAVRKQIDLDKPGRMNESIDILENWVKLQPHFLKKDFSRDYLERILLTTKGLVERAKERLDKICTFRTLMPDYFNVSNAKEEFTPCTKHLFTVHFRTLTPDYCRVYLNKVVSDANLESSLMMAFYKYMTMAGEYLLWSDYCGSFIIIFDYSGANVLNVISKINPIQLKQVTTLFTEGFGLRIKGVHIVSSSKVVDTVVSLFKQVFTPKVASRIHTHKSMESVFKFVPKEIFPSDYGGNEKCLKDLQADWLDAFSSKEFMDYYLDMKEARTDESRREINKFNEKYLGMPGSFRALSVD